MLPPGPNPLAKKDHINKGGEEKRGEHPSSSPGGGKKEGLLKGGQKEKGGGVCCPLTKTMPVSRQKNLERPEWGFF